MEALPVDLLERLHDLARVPVVLVASDYDGVLAPIVENPQDAKPLPESVDALCSLATCTGTHVAVVSGRSRRDLAALSGLPDEIHQVGSHGAEFDAGFTQDLTDQQLALRSKILARFSELAGLDPEFEIESKPASIAFHYRRVQDRDLAARVVDELTSTIATEPGVEVKLGKQVVELAVVETDKGTALKTLRTRLAAQSVFFMGDDVTDEDAFRALGESDIAIKVGPGPTAAPFRVASPENAAQVLVRLSELRKAWLDGSAVSN